MAFTIYLTRDFDQMSKVAADLVEANIRAKLSSSTKDEYVIGLATGSSPTGLYKYLAKAFNAGRIDASRIRTFNLDEYVGLPGENAQQRALHCESYGYFMIRELFGVMHRKLLETNVPWATLIDQAALVQALQDQPTAYEIRGDDKGKAICIKGEAFGILRMIKDEILDAYDGKIGAAGGIDLHVVGVGGRGHVGFHESGIPFEGSRVLLVKLDDNTVENAVKDGHFPCKENSPRYAVSMGAELVYEARTVLLLACGSRKTAPVTDSVLGPVAPAVPISYGQRYAAGGGNMIYVLDEAAAAGLLSRRDAVEAKGCAVLDMRGQPCDRLEHLVFTRDPVTGLLG